MPASAEWNSQQTIQTIIDIKKNRAPRLKDFPESVTFQPTTSLSKATIQNAIQEVWVRTETDVEHREHGRGFVIPYSRPNQLVPKYITTGTARHVEISVPIDHHRANHWQRDVCAFTVHSHGEVDLPFSMQDFFAVLIGPQLSTMALAASMVLTKSAQMVVFRSAQTPQLDEAQAAQKVAEMKTELNRKYHDWRIFPTNETIMELHIRNLIENCQIFSIALFASTRQETVLRRIDF